MSRCLPEVVAFAEQLGDIRWTGEPPWTNPACNGPPHVMVRRTLGAGWWKGTAIRRPAHRRNSYNSFPPGYWSTSSPPRCSRSDSDTAPEDCVALLRAPNAVVKWRHYRGIPRLHRRIQHDSSPRNRPTVDDQPHRHQRVGVGRGERRDQASTSTLMPWPSGHAGLGAGGRGRWRRIGATPARWPHCQFHILD